MNIHELGVRRVIVTVAIPVVAGLVGMLPGCAAGPQELHSATSVPASDGTVEATRGDNGNTKVAVRVQHLAQASRVAAGATTYVVWIKSRDGATQNVGALVLDEDLSGALDTVTPYAKFVLSVTPEPSSQVTTPTNKAVFSSRVQRVD